MAITRNIVDMMGGTISLTSKEGKGTEFIVTLNFKTLEKAMVLCQDLVQVKMRNFSSF